MSNFVIFPPSETPQRIEINWLANPPDALGRELPNGSHIVAPEDDPSRLYKFTPWEYSALARHEIAIYAHLQTRHDLHGLVRMEGISGTRDYLIRVMERSHIGSLEDVLRLIYRGEATPLSAERACALLARIAETMSHLHEERIVHRDLKAENILLFRSDYEKNGLEAKVSDLDRAIIMPKAPC